MLDTADDLDEAAAELGCPTEQLLTPLTRRRRQKPDGWFSIDNGAFANFSAPAFKRLLARHAAARDKCRFAAVPDVVGSAIRTLEVFSHWAPQMAGWPVALVCQDGQEDLPIPWSEIAAVFIGGSTEWKMSRHAIAVIKAAKALGKWVHVGRVNTPGRFEYFENAGADSVDGSGLAQYSHMRSAIHENSVAPRLL